MFSPDLSGSVYSPEFASLTDLGCIDRDWGLRNPLFLLHTAHVIRRRFPYRPEKYRDTDP